MLTKPLASVLFMAIFSLYLLSLGTAFYSSDGQVMFASSRALAFEGTLALEANPALPQIRQGADGRWYSQYDPGIPLLLTPLVWLGDRLAQHQRWHRYAFTAYLALWLTAAGAALAVAALFRLAEQLYSPGAASIIALLAALGTPLWIYSRYFFAEGLLAGLLALAWLMGYQRRAGWAGLALGLAILCRAATLIYVLPLLWLLLYPPPLAAFAGWRHPHLRPLLRFLLPLGLALLGLGYHNALRFGDPLRFGYTGQHFDHKPLVGIWGLLFSPGKSVFLYAPPLLLGVYCFPPFYRQHPRLAQSLLLAAGIALPFYGSWWAWDGGWSWAARFLVPLMPLWLLPLGLLLQDLPQRGRAWQAAFLLLALAGLGINTAGLLTDVNQHYAAVGNTDVVNYSFEHSPLVGALQQIFSGKTIPLAAFHLRDLGWLPGAALALPSLLMGMLCYGLVTLAKGLLYEAKEHTAEQSRARDAPANTGDL